MIENKQKILVTICARAGSKGIRGKNMKNLCGKPLITHTIDFAKKWGKGEEIYFSSDCEEMVALAKSLGAIAPVLRPSELATDTIGKMPVLHHALTAAEQFTSKKFDIVLDLDPTAPIRTVEDLNHGLSHFVSTKSDVCFSATKARKNPYFNMIERDDTGSVVLCKKLITRANSRQAAPSVWDMNASIYFYKRDFLAANPTSLWDGKAEFFEMSPFAAFDIDEERDFVIVEQLMKFLREGERNESI